MVGLTRFELVTPRLSSVCSNQLSYRPQRSCDEARDVKEPDFAVGFVWQAFVRLAGRSTQCEGRFLQNWTGRANTNPAGIRSISIGLLASDF